MDEKKKQCQDTIFALGANKVNPYDMWAKKANTFLKNCCGGKYTSHDFRKTFATDLYNATKDILKV